MKKVFLFCLTIFSSFCLNAQELKEVKTETSVVFKIKNFGANVDGHFETISLSALFNSKDELVDVSSKIKVKSISTGMESRDRHILKADFFHINKFDEITFNSINIMKSS